MRSNSHAGETSFSTEDRVIAHLKRNWITYALGAVIASIVLLWLSSEIAIKLTGYMYFVKEGKSTEYAANTIAIFSLIISSLSFAGLAVGVLIQQRSFSVFVRQISTDNDRQKQDDEESNLEKSERRAAIYERFSQDSVLEARDRLWEHTIKHWFTDKWWLSEMVYYKSSEIPKNGEPAISNRSDAEEEEAKTEIRNDSLLVTILIEFYIYVYFLYRNDSVELASALKRFYYAWWRGFLLSYSLKNKQAWEAMYPGDAVRKQIPFDENLELLLRIDAASGLPKFNPQLHPHYAKFELNQIMIDYYFPGLDNHNVDIRDL